MKFGLDVLFILENSWFNYIGDQRKSPKNETPYYLRLCTQRLVSFGQFMSKRHSKVNKACDFGKMAKIVDRAVIQYLHKKSLAPKGIHTEMVAIPGNDAPSLNYYNEKVGGRI